MRNNKAHVFILLWISIVSSLEVYADSEILFKDIVRQKMDVSCGPAMLATLFKYWLGVDVSENEVLDFIESTSSPEEMEIFRISGASNIQLQSFANYKGYEIYLYKLLADELYTNFKRPVIVHFPNTNPQHWTIYKGIVGNTVYMADSNLGNVKMSKDEFENRWINSELGNRGVILDFDVGHDFIFDSFLYQPGELGKIESGSSEIAEKYNSNHLEIKDAETQYAFNDQPAFLEIELGNHSFRSETVDNVGFRESYNSIKLTVKPSAIYEYSLESIGSIETSNTGGAGAIWNISDDMSFVSFSVDRVISFKPKNTLYSLARVNMGVEKNIEDNSYGVSLGYKMHEKKSNGSVSLEVAYSMASEKGNDNGFYVNASMIKEFFGLEFISSGEIGSKGISHKIFEDSLSFTVGKKINRSTKISAFYEYDHIAGEIDDVSGLYKSTEKTLGVAAHIKMFENSKLVVSHRKSFISDSMELGAVFSHEFLF